LTTDLFDNADLRFEVSYLTSLAFFRAKVNFSSAKIHFNTEVVQKLKFPNNSDIFYEISMFKLTVCVPRHIPVNTPRSMELSAKSRPLETAM